MTTRRLTRRLPAIAGAAAIIALVGLSAACAKEEEKAPRPRPPRPRHDHDDAAPAAPHPEPTEKAPRIEPGPEPVLAHGDRTAGADGASWRQLARTAVPGWRTSALSGTTAAWR